MNKKLIASSLVAALAVFALSGCAASPQPTPTALASPMSAEEAWVSFAEIADKSCQKAYEGLVEEDIDGPNTGKLKIRLTFEQAGENSFALKMPDGTLSEAPWMEYYACEASFAIDNIDIEDSSIPPYSADLPLKVSFDHVTATYLTTQVVSGNERKLSYTVADEVISQVENLVEGSKTKLTFGLPDAEKTAIVNDFYAEMYG